MLTACTSTDNKKPLDLSHLSNSSWSYGLHGYEINYPSNKKIYDLEYQYDIKHIIKANVCNDNQTSMCRSQLPSVAGLESPMPDIFYLSWVTKDGVKRVEHIPLRKILTGLYNKKRLMNYYLKLNIEDEKISMKLVLSVMRVPENLPYNPNPPVIYETITNN